MNNSIHTRCTVILDRFNGDMPARVTLSEAELNSLKMALEEQAKRAHELLLKQSREERLLSRLDYPAR